MSREVWGLAGKYCAGKNRAAAILQEAGCEVLDADRMGHEVLEEEKEAVASRFGREILDAEGRINRKALGERVFGRPEELKALEAIVHPPVIRRIRDSAESDDSRPLVINAALLFSSDLHSLCNRVIWISAPLRVRIKRGLNRDGHSLSHILKRIWTQRKLSPQPWQKDVDIYSIPNSGTEEELREGVRNFLK